MMLDYARIAAAIYAEVSDEPLGDLDQRRPRVQKQWEEAVRAALVAEGAVAWPKHLTPALRGVLGLMCFQLARHAHLYQEAGEFVGAGGLPLKHGAEDEQAFMLHKLLGYVFESGDDGEKYFEALQADTDRALKIIADRKAARHAGLALKIIVDRRAAQQAGDEA